MPSKGRCETCGTFQASTRIRVVRCASADACGCPFPSDRKEALCDRCASYRKEIS